MLRLTEVREPETQIKPHCQKSGQAEVSSKVMVPNCNGPPLEAGIWFPSDAPGFPRRLGLYTQTVAAGGEVAGRSLPQVVISHEAGGSFQRHYDTALTLAVASWWQWTPKRATTIETGVGSLGSKTGRATSRP